ncbi:class I SAM-dependent methyltransferase [Candidatus Nomurabacteria bacterium]|nr:class I SAM-dependent methyltransferase [Candidatus Nomurabacteria bacterium]
MNKDIRKQYNNFHDLYTENFADDEVSNSLFHKTIDFNLEKKKILDVGCGDGKDLVILSKKTKKIFGIDPSIEFLKKAQINNPSGIFKEAVGEKIPFQNESFDVVVSKWAIQTSTNVPKVLSEMARVLKKGGSLVFLTKHPILQFLQKIRDYGHGVDYYKQQITTSKIYSGTITIKEPSHTIGEYFNAEFLKNFEIIDYKEGTDFPASTQINGDTYPTFFIVKAKKK